MEILIQWFSYCFPVEKADRQEFIHIDSSTFINEDIKIRKTMRGTQLLLNLEINLTGLGEENEVNTEQGNKRNRF